MSALAPRVRARIRREAWLAGFGILGALWLAKEWAGALPGASLILTLVVGLQLYGPIARIGRDGVSWESLGLRRDRWASDVSSLGLICLLTFPPYVLGFHLWKSELLGLAFVFRVPRDFLWTFLSQTLVLALAEEVFFRGYLQERFDRVYPPRIRFWGAQLGWGLVISSVFFALAHFVGEWNPTRLAPFFPSFAFGFLRARTGSIVAATSYHALCNALADLMFACYR
ncbi:MAG: type II CAAX endopeptidase family protein [Myxococcota bacterium]